VSFTDGTARRFDLVVGTDGLRSHLRDLTFAPGVHRMRHHGYHVAGFTMPNLLGLHRRGVTYSVPGGRGVSVTSSRDDEARALFVFASEDLDGGERDAAVQKRIVRHAFASLGWEAPRLLDAMDAADDLYFDAIASVDVDCFSRGRVVLLGDAAWGGTIGGQGTGVAIVGAYVLAGEMATANGDHATAFARYEDRMRRFALRCQAGASRAGMFLAPRTRWGLAFRNYSHRALTSRPLSGVFERMVRSAAESFELPTYVPAGSRSM
jgi:2-polyprenyl-6-methoxyphenol hydroxylase-like FAD-dependent oxidoreductase